MTNHGCDKFHPGKWLLFFSYSELDEKWEITKSLISNQIIQSNAKCSTRFESPYATNKNSGVIAVYTGDYNNTEEVFHIAEILKRELKVERKIYYKTNEQTAQGLYRSRGNKKNHLYSF